MLTRMNRSKYGTTLLVGVAGMLLAILALPLLAAPPKSKARRTVLVQQTAANATETASKDPASPAPNPAAAEDLPTIDVLKGIRTGELSATAEGTGDGRMTLSLTNRTGRKLRVVLPPGLIASSATGQFGGGMGMMGGGMGGGMEAAAMMGGMGGMGGGKGGGMMGGMGGKGGMEWEVWAAWAVA